MTDRIDEIQLRCLTFNKKFNWVEVEITDPSGHVTTKEYDQVVDSNETKIVENWLPLSILQEPGKYKFKFRVDVEDKGLIESPELTINLEEKILPDKVIKFIVSPDIYEPEDTFLPLW